jgi:hypothetical protein
MNCEEAGMAETRAQTMLSMACIGAGCCTRLETSRQGAKEFPKG